MLALHARVEVLDDAPAAARVALAEAQELGDRLQAGPESEVGREIARARAVLEAS